MLLDDFPPALDLNEAAVLAGDVEAWQTSLKAEGLPGVQGFEDALLHGISVPQIGRLSINQRTRCADFKHVIMNEGVQVGSPVKKARIS